MVDAKRGLLHRTVAAQGCHYFPDRSVHYTQTGSVSRGIRRWEKRKKARRTRILPARIGAGALLE